MGEYWRKEKSTGSEDSQAVSDRHSDNTGRVTRQSSRTNGQLSMTQWRAQEFCTGGGGSINSVQDRGQRELGSGERKPPSQEFWRQL